MSIARHLGSPGRIRQVTVAKTAASRMAGKVDFAPAVYLHHPVDQRVEAQQCISLITKCIPVKDIQVVATITIGRKPLHLAGVGIP